VWVGAGPGADLLGDVNTLLSCLQVWHQLGDVLAFCLRLQVASLLWDLSDNSLSLIMAFLSAGLQIAAFWAAELTWDLLAPGFWRVLLDRLLLLGTDLLGPLGALNLGGVTLGDIHTLLLMDGLAINDIILNFMLVVPGLTLRLVDSPTLLIAFTITDQWGVAELDTLIMCYRFEFNEALLDEVLVALLLLLRLVVSDISVVTLLAVAVLALDDIIVLGLSNHDDLLDTPFTSSGNGSNVQRWMIIVPLTWPSRTSSRTALAGIPSCIIMMFVVLLMVVIVVSMMGRLLAPTSIERESIPQVFPFACNFICSRRRDC